jgi:hypothetical protein
VGVFEVNLGASDTGTREDESVDAAIHLLPLGGEADPLRSRLGRVPGLSCVELCGLLGHSQLSDEVTSPCAIEPLHCLFKLDAVASFLTPARPTRHRC